MAPHRANPQARGDERRLDVVLTARRVLIREGASGFSVRKVAKDGGISLGHLQHFFPSKRDLLFAILEHTTAQYSAAYDEFVDGLDGNPLIRFRRVVDYLARDAQDPEVSAFFIEFWSLTLRDPEARAMLKRLYAKNQRELARCIAQVRPDLDARRVQTMTIQAVTAIDGFLIYSHTADPSARTLSSTRRALVTSLEELVLEGGR